VRPKKRKKEEGEQGDDGGVSARCECLAHFDWVVN